MTSDYGSTTIGVTDADFRRTVIFVAALNLAYFGVEFAVALAIGSVSLFADSVDFLEDAAVNLLIATALAWSATRRATVGKCLAGLLLVPALALLWALWSKYDAPVPPSAIPLGSTGIGRPLFMYSALTSTPRWR